VIHHVQQWVRFPQHVNTDNILKAHTKDTALWKNEDKTLRPKLKKKKKQKERKKIPGLLFSNFQDGALSRHQDTLVMELLQHSQGTMGHDDLIL